MPKSMPKQKTSRPKVPPPISPAKWQAMTPRQRLLAIAKDVLAQLNQRRFQPTAGVYLRGTELDALARLNADDLRQQLVATKATAQCRACAIGSMWLSRIRLADGVDGDRLYAHQGVREEIGYEQASEIEAAFESLSNEPTWTASEEFGARYGSATLRLRRIMENIVAGRGVFNPARKQR